MSQKYSAPGVYRESVDQSDIVSPVSTSVGGLVGFGYKGPINFRNLLFRDREFYNTYGTPVNGDSGEFSLYGAGKFLKESDRLYYVRVSEGDEFYSNLSFSTEGFAVDVSGTLAVDLDGLFATYGNGFVSAMDISATATKDLLTIDGYLDGNKSDNIYDIEVATLSVNTSLLIASIGPGIYGNDIGVSIVTTASDVEQGLYDWQYKFDDMEDNGTPSSATDAIYKSVYRVNVYQKPYGKGEEYWEAQGGIRSLPLETFLVSNDPNIQDSNGNSLYIKDVINGVSKYIYANPVDYSYPIPTVIVHALDNGQDGSYATVANINAGYDLFTDPEKVMINILMTSEEGTSAKSSISKKVSSVVNSRLDCFGVAQAGGLSNTTATSIVNLANTYYAGYSLPSYMGLYTGYTQIFDDFTGKKIYLPNSIFASAIIARSDALVNVYAAPAGPNRGVIGEAIGQLTIFNKSEIGYLYDYNLNTVAYKNGYGFVLDGQKTAQRKKSALDRINARRTVTYIENSLEPLLTAFEFEPNTEKTRSRLYSIVDGFLSTVKAEEGVSAYKIICDESNNTPEVIDNNELLIEVYVAPVRTAEFIRLRTIITRTGAIA